MVHVTETKGTLDKDDPRQGQRPRRRAIFRVDGDVVLDNAICISLHPRRKFHHCIDGKVMLSDDFVDFSPAKTGRCCDAATRLEPTWLQTSARFVRRGLPQACVSNSNVACVVKAVGVACGKRDAQICVCPRADKTRVRCSRRAPVKLWMAPAAIFNP